MRQITGSSLSLACLTGQDDSHIHWLSAKIGLHSEVYQAYQAMANAAKKDNINIDIASGFRSFKRQLTIFTGKVNGRLAVKDANNQLIDLASLSEWQKLKAVLIYSALPGGSRHHWGTDIDVYDASQLADGQSLQLEPWEYQGQGPFAKLTDWLQQYSQEFGFYLPYDNYRGGIAIEPWHLSYYPVASEFERQLKPNVYLNAIASVELPLKTTIIEHVETIFSRFIENIGRPNE